MSGKYAVQLSPSGRATCQNSNCKATIELNSLRVGILNKNDASKSSKFMHLDCADDYLGELKGQTLTESVLHGITGLDKNDQSLVKDAIKGARNA